MTQLKKGGVASDLSVLISGETGTGKELVAAIHEACRGGEPLALSTVLHCRKCGGKELFGHVKGAFTGAISNRSGKFEMADNGTLFLDGSASCRWHCSQLLKVYPVWRYSARWR